MKRAELENGIVSLMDAMGNETDVEKAKRTYAKGLSQLIEDFVKSAKVTVIAESGQIAVTGSATNQANPAPISIIGNPDGAIKGGLE